MVAINTATDRRRVADRLDLGEIGLDTRAPTLRLACRYVPSTVRSSSSTWLRATGHCSCAARSSTARFEVGDTSKYVTVAAPLTTSPARPTPRSPHPQPRSRAPSGPETGPDPAEIAGIATRSPESPGDRPLVALLTLSRRRSTVVVVTDEQRPYGGGSGGGTDRRA